LNKNILRIKELFSVVFARFIEYSLNADVYFKAQTRMNWSKN